MEQSSQSKPLDPPESAIVTEDKARLSAQEIYTTLREMINSLEIQPGARITESQLADYFAVSRTPIRAALHKLESDKLLKIKPKQGCFIRKIELSQISQYYDVRVTLENMVLTEISRQTDNAQLQVLAQQWDPARCEFGVQVTHELKLAAEIFHVDLAKLSHNTVLQNFIADINQKIRGVRLLGWPDEKSVSETYEEHHRICHLLLCGDLATAQAEMTVHIRNSQEKASQVTVQQLYTNRNFRQFT